MHPSDRPSPGAIRTSAQLFEAGRWDAAFHVASAHHEAAMAALKVRFTPEQAGQAVGVISPAELGRTLQSLGRGNPIRPEEAARLVKDHPYLVLAMVQDALPLIQANTRQQLDDAQQKAAALNDLAERMGPPAPASAAPAPRPRR